VRSEIGTTVSNWIVTAEDPITAPDDPPSTGDNTRVSAPDLPEAAVDLLAEEVDVAARPWPPPGPDTGWWRDDGAARPFTPSSPHVPAPARAQAAGATPSRVADEDPPAIETAPARRSSNVGPEGFPSPQMRAAARSGTALAPAPPAMDPPEPIVPGFPAGSDDAWPPAGLRVASGHRGDTPVTASRAARVRGPRRPFFGLAGLLIFALLAAFLSWFAAGPLWLSVGHGTSGTAKVVSCPVGGLSRKCADFVAADRSFTAYVALLGPRSMDTKPGALVPARMVSDDASTAYAGDTASLYLRWVPSVILTLLCGFGIFWSTGVRRLPRRRARWVAGVGSLLAPVLLLIGMLAFAF
jgi:hypothetical protein